MKDIYTFEVFVDKEVEKEVEKKRQKTDKDTGEVKKWTETVKESVKESVPFLVSIRRPSRSVQEEADLFYSIRFNKYVSLGLLTESQIAQKQIDLGDGMSSEQLEKYIKLKELATQKEETLYRINLKDDLSEEDEDRKSKLITDLISLNISIAEYEKLKISAYSHTADSKAQRDTLLWLSLNLTYVKDLSSDDSKPEHMFEGADYESKLMDLEEKEDSSDELLSKSYKTLTDVISIWYYMGLEDKTELDDTLKQMRELESQSEDS